MTAPVTRSALTVDRQLGGKEPCRKALMPAFFWSPDRII